MIDKLSIPCALHRKRPKETLGNISRPSCTSLWLVTVPRITAIENRLYGCLCAREHLLASMAFIVDDTSHLVLLGAVAYFYGHFGLQIVLSLKGSPCPDHDMQMHIRTPANTLKNHVAFAETHSARYLHDVSCPKSESWLNPAANSASTLYRGQG